MGAWECVPSVQGLRDIAPLRGWGLVDSSSSVGWKLVLRMLGGRIISRLLRGLVRGGQPRAAVSRYLFLFCGGGEIQSVD